MVKLSFVIPCYGSEQTLPLVVAELRQALAGRGEADYQLILVNDGSPDRVWPIIRELAAADPRVLGLNLARNFGQAKARMAALPHIRGQIAVFLDDDGQHPLEQVYELIDQVAAGYDLVFARFPHKRHQPLRRLASALNGWLLELTRAKPKGVSLSSFFAVSRLAVDQLLAYQSPFPSFTSYIMQCSDRVTNVDLPHRPRQGGKSGYTFPKLAGQWLTGFTNFSILPLRFAGVLGGLIAAVGLVYGLTLVIRKLCGAALLPGYTSLMAALLFVGGLIMLTLGLLGEYVGRIYMTVSDLPRYVVRETAGKEEDA